MARGWGALARWGAAFNDQNAVLGDWGPTANGLLVPQPANAGQLFAATGPGATTWLNPGTVAQVLGIAAGVPAWVSPSAVNPGPWTGYVPVVSGTGWVLGNGSVAGRFRLLDAKTLAINVTLSVGTTTVVGSGALGIGFPAGVTSANTTEQECAAHAHLPGVAEQTVIGTVGANTTTVNPLGPNSATSSADLPWSTGNVVPPSGSSVWISGVIEIA